MGGGSSRFQMKRVALLLLLPSFSFGFGLPQLAHLHVDFTPGTTVYLTAGSGSILAEANEAAAQVPYYQGGTFSKLWLNVPINTLTSPSVCTIRINGVSGNETVTVGAGATGTFTDNTHTDHIAPTNLVDFKCVLGPTGTSFRIQGNMAQFTPDYPFWFMKWMANTWPGTYTGQTNGYADFYEIPIGMMGNGGGLWANQTESPVYYMMHSSGTFMNMAIYVSSNTRGVIGR